MKRSFQTCVSKMTNPRKLRNWREKNFLWKILTQDKINKNKWLLKTPSPGAFRGDKRRFWCIFRFAGSQASGYWRAMADYWRKILEKLEKMLDSSDFRVWIEPLTAEIAGHSLVLSMPGASSYYLGRLKKRFEPVIRTAAAEAFSCSRDDVELTFKSVAASRDSVSVKKISVAVRKSDQAASPP